SAFADARFTLGAYGFTLASSARAWRKSSAASTPVLPLPEMARLATQMANEGSRPASPNHFFRTVNRVRFALPRDPISAEIFRSFSEMSVRTAKCPCSSGSGRGVWRQQAHLFGHSQRDHESIRQLHIRECV